MCGIAGIFSHTTLTDNTQQALKVALGKMHHRGPDFTSVWSNNHVQMGHARLSIIDTSPEANQPMVSDDGKYVLVFNGEIFNFRELKSSLEGKGIHFHTRSDTEVLLHLLIREGKNALNKLNGFFALAFYNLSENEILLARDRFGEKPLKYFYKDKKLCFASDLNALKVFYPSPSIDMDALQLYFQFNYIPAPYTIYQSMHKLMPGEWITANENGMTSGLYYQLSKKELLADESEIRNKLRTTLNDAVKIRLISDVPLGSFLSGGIDSTIISGIAHDHDPELNTFSIGFPDQKHFDETLFAKIASKHLGTKHEVFEVTGKKLLEHMPDVIGKMDEPFADSSALAVYELTKQTRSKITVALSGDGADELFGGYHKHLAHQKAAKKNMTNFLLKHSAGILKSAKGSRNSKTGNRLRKIKKYSSALKLDPVERYLQWASVLTEKERKNLFASEDLSEEAKNKLHDYFRFIDSGKDLNEILLTDISLVLANDMLVKTDMMSMANSLEVRPPFLDHRIAELSLQIPEKYKIRRGSKKDILKETFAAYLPDDLKNRPKKGFEVPLHAWFNNELKKRLENEWLNETGMIRHSLFNSEFIVRIRKMVFSSAPGESPATVWALIVLQEWMKNNGMRL